jgi:hypothetical protein
MRVPIGIRWVVAAAIALSAASVARAEAQEFRQCNIEDPDCFDVVICQNLLDCSGGPQLCADVGEMGLCYQAVQ